MASRSRVLLFVLLLITAATALRVPAPGPSMPAADRTPTTVVIGWLIVLIAPALLVLLYAGLRYRSPPPRPPARPRLMRPKAGAVPLALAALLAVTAALAALPRLLPPTRTTVRGGDESPSGPETSAPASPPPAEPAGTGGSALEVAGTAVAVALLLLLAVAALRARPSVPHDVPRPETSARTGTGSQPLAAAAGEALTAIDSPGTDPRTAIIDCYAAMERALAEAPAAAPRPADAPADVLRRATEQGQLSVGTGSTLLDLFHEARYSTHPMTEADRGTASATLRAILAELGRPRWRPS